MLERTKEGRDTVLLMLYAAVIDDEEDMLRFERIYYGYRKQMFYVANVILSDEYDAEVDDSEAISRKWFRIVDRE